MAGVWGMFSKIVEEWPYGSHFHAIRVTAMKRSDITTMMLIEAFEQHGICRGYDHLLSTGIPQKLLDAAILRDSARGLLTYGVSVRCYFPES